MRFVELKDRCRYFTEQEECAFSEYIPYEQVLFCMYPWLTDQGYWLTIILLCVWVALLICFLGTFASAFFNPTLTAIAHICGLTQTIGGVTVLAFSQDPVLISKNIVFLEKDTAGHFSYNFGIAIFITTVVSGRVIMTNPFTLKRDSFIRVVSFYLVAVLWVYYTQLDNSIDIYETISYFALYFIFLTIVLVTHFYKKKINRMKKRRQGMDGSVEDAREHIRFVLDKRSRNVTLGTYISRSASKPIEESEPVTLEGEEDLTSTRQTVCEDFLYQINPITYTEWRHMTILNKILALLFVPVITVMKFIIPVVNYDVTMHGWCRLLNSIHCVTLPAFFMFDTGIFFLDLWFGIQLYQIVLPIGIAIGLAVLLTSSTFTIPKYHVVFAFASYVGNLLFMRRIDRETTVLADFIGTLLGISSSAALGMSVVVVSDCIPALITNADLAKHGHARMAFSSCFGGPMFAILIGFGIQYAGKLVHEKSYSVYVRVGDFGTNCVWFLSLILIVTLIMAFLMNFYTRRSLAIFLFLMYSIFTMFNILGGLELIHTLGSGHSSEPHGKAVDFVLDDIKN